MTCRRRSKLVALRHAVQLLALLLFAAVLLAARPAPGRPPPDWLGIVFFLDPLVLLVTAIAAHAVAAGLLLALLTAALTVLLGRVFCGWLCPLGTLHAITARLFDRWPRRPSRDHTSRWQLLKYGVLVGLVVAAAAGVSWLALFDPLVLLYRTGTTALWPLAQAAAERAATAAYRHDPAFGPLRLTSITEPAYRLIRDALIVQPGQSFLGSGLILAFFVSILALNAVRRRFWCRYVCPLGGLLGLLAWRPWLHRRVNAQDCNQCDICGLACHGAASGGPGTAWKPQECLGCMNCTAACPTDGVTFSFAPPWRQRAANDSIDLRRRHLLAAAAGGLATATVLRVSPQARGATFHARLIRPPGARSEREFLSRCLACGACMKVCPTGGLQPTFLEAGLHGLWTPHLVPALGYCDYECNRCGDVCPTQAIEPLPLAAKKQVRIGLATIDPSRCLPFAYNRECLVCEEHCPIPDKAIVLVPATYTTRRGRTRPIRQPRVCPERCTGCGICENVCPFKDAPAIRVTSAGESRHPANQAMLE